MTADRPLSASARRTMLAWLALLGLMVYAMILIGGATRLTDSGLSITEWDVISGTLLPMSDAAWERELEKYRQTAEYQTQNFGMTMAEFQWIYAWEWGHRVFGRLIGLVAVAGFAYFAVKGWLSRKLAWRFGVIIALGALQGAIGWWMVASGIGETDRVDVAPYRLAVHFSLALLIIALIAWAWADLRAGERRAAAKALPAWQRWSAYGLLALVGVQMASGALVAGLDAGRSYNDWPLMNGEWVPSQYLHPELGAASLVEGRAATQFNHRAGAYLLWAASLWFAFAARGSALGRPALMLAGLVSLQAVWGIVTLLHTAPMALALVHQGLGVIVTLAAVSLAWRAASIDRLPARSAPGLSARPQPAE